MAQDLPAYLDLVKRGRPEEIVVISKELDPAYELTALVVKLEREAREAHCFELRLAALARGLQCSRRAGHGGGAQEAALHRTA
mgnify:CR=1 FL=1